jgi:hypothetical protein
MNLAVMVTMVEWLMINKTTLSGPLQVVRDSRQASGVCIYTLLWCFRPTASSTKRHIDR